MALDRAALTMAPGEIRLITLHLDICMFNRACCSQVVPRCSHERLASTENAVLRAITVPHCDRYLSLSTDTFLAPAHNQLPCCI